MMNASGTAMKYYFHLKKGPTDDAKLGGKKYLTLCGHWVFDSIASDVDCVERWVTCPDCAKQDPHPEFQATAPALLQRGTEIPAATK